MKRQNVSSPTAAYACAVGLELSIYIKKEGACLVKCILKF